MSLDRLDRLNRLISQAKAVVVVTGEDELLDTISVKNLSNIFWLLEDHLSEMEKHINELSKELQRREVAHE
jgi:hypothetical protein